MSVLDELDAASRRSGFTFRLGGQVWPTPDPADMPYQEILEALYFGGLPAAPPGMTLRKRSRLLAAWAAHHDLPTLSECQRLLYYLDCYHDHLEYDLLTIAQVDLGELFRQRRWRYLLNLINHLPRHTHYAEAVSQDPEHTKILAAAMAAHAEEDEDSEKTGPALHTWTPEVAVLHDLLDAVRRIPWAVFQSQSSKKVEVPAAVPRPTTALERGIASQKRANRQHKHDTLAARILPHKRPKPQ